MFPPKLDQERPCQLTSSDTVHVVWLTSPPVSMTKAAILSGWPFPVRLTSNGALLATTPRSSQSGDQFEPCRTRCSSVPLVPSATTSMRLPLPVTTAEGTLSKDPPSSSFCPGPVLFCQV